MAFLILPNFPEQGRHQYDTEISGVEFTFEFTYHERLSNWYLEIRDSLDVVLRTGIRIVVDWPLTYRERLRTLPDRDGLLFALDISGEEREIEAQSELGDRVQLVFIPDEDLPVTPAPAGLIFEVVTPP